MRYASVIIGILVILILVGVAVAFMRTNGAPGVAAYGANPYGTVASNQVACPQNVRPVQTVPVYQAQQVNYQAYPYYQASAYIPTYVAPAATTCGQMAYGAYGTASVYPVMAAYYPMGAQTAWYTAPSQGQYYGYGGYYGTNRTTQVIYQNPGYQYDYQYQYQNTQVIPGQTNTYVYPYDNGGWYK